MALNINKSKLFKEFFEEFQNREIKHLVLHHIEADNIEDAIEELKKHQVSSHYIIDNNGDVFNLVDEKNIAYHAGVSYWNNKYNLNNSSIGIEFFSKNAEEIGFSKEQIESGIKLCQEIIKKYNIDQKNILGHSDIAYEKETGFLNRKQDPSHLFPWQEFSQNNVGIYPQNSEENNQNPPPFSIGNKDPEILKIKEKLKDFGYKIDNVNDEFDEEFKNVTIAFNRRFNQKQYLINKERWFKSSTNTLEVLV